jgi:hypothetical protein
MAQENKGQILLNRFNKEVVEAPWDDQFKGFESSITDHYNKLWESLFSDVKGWTPLGIALHFLGKHPGNKTLINIVRCMPGYWKRYREYNRRVKQEDSAASKFAVSPETAQTRKKLGYEKF